MTWSRLISRTWIEMKWNSFWNATNRSLTEKRVQLETESRREWFIRSTAPEKFLISCVSVREKENHRIQCDSKHSRAPVKFVVENFKNLFLVNCVKWLEEREREGKESIACRCDRNINSSFVFLKLVHEYAKLKFIAKKATPTNPKRKKNEKSWKYISACLCLDPSSNVTKHQPLWISKKIKKGHTVCRKKHFCRISLPFEAFRTIPRARFTSPDKLNPGKNPKN